MPGTCAYPVNVGCDNLYCVNVEVSTYVCIVYLNPLIYDSIGIR